MIITTCCFPMVPSVSHTAVSLTCRFALCKIKMHCIVKHYVILMPMSLFRSTTTPHNETWALPFRAAVILLCVLVRFVASSTCHCFADKFYFPVWPRLFVLSRDDRLHVLLNYHHLCVQRQIMSIIHATCPICKLHVQFNVELFYYNVFLLKYIRIILQSRVSILYRMMQPISTVFMYKVV